MSLKKSTHGRIVSNLPTQIGALACLLTNVSALRITRSPTLILALDDRMPCSPSPSAGPTLAGRVRRALSMMAASSSTTTSSNVRSVWSRSTRNALFETELRYDAVAWLRRSASRWRRLRSRMRRTGAIEGVGGRVAAGAGSSAARTSGSSLAC